MPSETKIIAAAIDGDIARGLLDRLDVGDFGQLRQIGCPPIAQADGVAVRSAAAFELHDLHVELGDVGEQAVDVVGRADDLLIEVLCSRADLAVEPLDGAASATWPFCTATLRTATLSG